MRERIEKRGRSKVEIYNPIKQSFEKLGGSVLLKQEVSETNRMVDSGFVG